jgi:hypothetical protein
MKWMKAKVGPKLKNYPRRQLLCDVHVKRPIDDTDRFMVMQRIEQFGCRGVSGPCPTDLLLDPTRFRPLPLCLDRSSAYFAADTSVTFLSAPREYLVDLTTIDCAKC